MNKRGWFGIDESNEVSLFDYNLLMRRAGGMYQVIVPTPKDDEYVYGWFDDKQLIEDLDSNSKFPSWEALADTNGITTEGYREQILGNDRDDRAVMLLDDMITTYGIPDSVYIDPGTKVYTEKEIRKRLNRGLTYKK